ncbi:MAG: 50S ribosomal protein L19e, partial [Thermoplasmata archaeon]
MNLRNQKRMAAEILGCGINRIWIDPNALGELANAVTREDIRNAIAAGVIKAKKVKGNSKARIRYRAKQRAKGRQRGIGSREGSKFARMPRKLRWMQTIRAVRSLLKTLRANGKISRKDYRKLYYQAKGGVFKSKAHLRMQLKMQGILK